MNPQDHAYALPAGYMLEEYRIEGMLGRGGFGMTYLAQDTHLNKRVAIKEYLPNDLAMRDAERTVRPKSSADAGNYRWGLERFLAEAQVLAGFDHAHINKVYRRFQAHGTAYLVLEYVSGETLSDRLRRMKVLTPEEAWRLFTELLSGLEVVHRQDYVHRDIKPLNIMLREDGASVLLDFGAARQVVGQLSKSITSLLTPGYAPIEQYDSKAAHVGPWSDFYALGVTVYRCVTGVSEGAALLEAPARMVLQARSEAEKDMRPAAEVARGGYDRRLLRAIDECMKVDGRERPQSVAALRSLLGEGSEPVPPNPPPSPPQPDEDKDKDKDKPSPLVTFVCAVLAFGGLGLWGASKGLFSPSPPLSPAFRDALKSGGEGPEMVVLPTGRFRMGSPSGEEGRDDDEGPVRTVTIGKRIAMGRYEVTFADYDRFVAATSGRRPDDLGWGRGSRPVIGVSQKDAKAYAAWLSAQTGKTYRLPSESEWEYAARAGTETAYSWGNEIGFNRANCVGCGSVWYNRQTAPVGSFAANAFGLFDMHGNVDEWVEDCYVDSYVGAPSDGSARTSGCGANVLAVERGGSWVFSPQGLRSANRDWDSPSNRINDNGFRLVQDLNP